MANMADHAKQVGILKQHVIDLLGLDQSAGKSILLGETNISHMMSRHPRDYELYGQCISEILSEPDYVALSEKDGSIEYVKEMQLDTIYVKVAVRVSLKGQLYVRSLYRLNVNRVKNFIEKGTLKSY